MDKPEKTDYGQQGSVDKYGGVPPKAPVQRGPVVVKPASTASQESQPAKNSGKSGQK
jgi:hypothetical protein